jgi:hypothetical protein
MKKITKVGTQMSFFLSLQTSSFLFSPYHIYFIPAATAVLKWLVSIVQLSLPPLLPLRCKGENEWMNEKMGQNLIMSYSKDGASEVTTLISEKHEIWKDLK